MGDNLFPELREHLWDAALARAREYCEARWPDQVAYPGFVHELAEHFMDYYRRADDEACDVLDEQSRVSPREWVVELDAAEAAERLVSR